MREEWREGDDKSFGRTRRRQIQEKVETCAMEFVFVGDTKSIFCSLCFLLQFDCTTVAIVATGVACFI